MKKVFIALIIVIALFVGIKVFAAGGTCTLTVSPTTAPLGANNTLVATWTSSGATTVNLTETDGNLQTASITTLVKNGSISMPFVGALTHTFKLNAGTAVCTAKVLGTSTTQP